jgi:hypothetical protein
MEIPVIQWGELTEPSLSWGGEHVVDTSRPALKVIGGLGVSQLALIGRRGLATAIRGVRGVQNLLVSQTCGRSMSARSQRGCRIDGEGWHCEANGMDTGKKPPTSFNINRQRILRRNMTLILN